MKEVNTRQTEALFTLQGGREREKERERERLIAHTYRALSMAVDSIEILNMQNPHFDQGRD